MAQKFKQYSDGIVYSEIEESIGLDATEAVGVSAKTGLNVDQVLEAIVEGNAPDYAITNEEKLRTVALEVGI